MLFSFLVPALLGPAAITRHVGTKTVFSITAMSLLRARPKAERVFAEYENFLKLSDPTVTLFSVLYLLNQTTD